jgi:MATE family multidrug resistance protein
VVRGIGWQQAGAIANLGAYYGVALPIALLLVFKFGFDGRVRITKTFTSLQDD